MTSQSKVKYRIRDMVTGLYQDTGYDKRGLHAEAIWTEKGKTWGKLSDLKSHLSLLQEQHITISPLWQIVEFESSETEKYCYLATALV